jgi:hypothetical protein
MYAMKATNMAALVSLAPLTIFTAKFYSKLTPRE